MFQKPQQRLPHRAQLQELAENQKNGLLHAPVRIFFQTLILRLDVTHRCRLEQFPTTCLLPARFHRTLPQQIQLILIQAAFEAKQKPVVAEPRGVHHLLIDQNGVHHTAHLHQLLPLAAVAAETRNFARCHRAHFSQTDFCYHTLESGSGDQPGSRSSQVIIHDFNLVPSQLMQPLFHRVLQLLTLQVVDHLISGGLTNIENRFPCQVLWPDLLTHRPPPVSRSRSGGASVRSTSWPRVAPSSAALLRVTRGASWEEKTNRLDGFCARTVCASASPELLD